MVNKSIIILIAAGVLIVTVVIFVVLLRFKSSGKVATPISEIQQTPSIAEELSTWTDQSGFSFQYPQSLSLNSHDEDKENYAHIELTSATHPGNLIVWVKDTEVGSIDDWIKQEKIQGSLDSTLGSEAAKKVLISGDSSKILTSSIKDGYLYQIEVNPKDFNYWNKISDLISSTYKFLPIQEKTGKTSVSAENTSDNSSTEEGSSDEEVVE